jgi:hypothetical protein
MPSLGIKRTDVFMAAKVIAEQGFIPTQHNVRKYLGCGSKGTIHKYLKQWKQECFSHGNSVNKTNLKTINTEETRELKQALVKQTSKNEELSSQLIQAEQNLAQIKANYQELNKKCILLQEENLQLSTKKNKYKLSLKSIMADRKAVLDRVLVDKDCLIGSLRQEIAEINRISIEQIKELGRKGDDALIEAKVKSINLQDEVSQQKNIIDELREQFLKSQETIRILKQEIERQHKFTQEVVNIAPVSQTEALTLQLEE